MNKYYLKICGNQIIFTYFYTIKSGLFIGSSSTDRFGNVIFVNSHLQSSMNFVFFIFKVV